VVVEGACSKTWRQRAGREETIRPSDNSTSTRTVGRIGRAYGMRFSVITHCMMLRTQSPVPRKIATLVAVFCAMDALMVAQMHIGMSITSSC
jgi:hypothetical protein